MGTSWGQRKALGKRYGQDPALLMELERLQKEYDLAPGREARALQASQFDRSLAQQQSQFDTNQANAASAGQAGTAVNLATNAAMIRALTMEKGEPFFGRTATGYYDKVMGNPPAQYQPVAGSTNVAGQAGAGAYAGGTAAQYINGAPAPQMTTLAQSTPVGNYTPGMGYGTSPSTMPEAAAPVGMGTPGATAGASTAAATGYGTVQGFGTGIGEMSSSVMGVPGLQVAGAGYAGPKLVEGIHPGSMENIGHNITGGLIRDEKTAKVFGSTATGAAAGAAMGTAVLPGPGTLVGGVIGAIAGGISEIFGW